MRTILYLTAPAVLCTILTARVTKAAENTAGEIIALTRGALDRWGNGDVEGLLTLYSPDVTYFDPYQDKRVDGIEAMKKIYAPIAGKVKIDHYEMIDPKVQRHGDAAILTFNLVDDASETPDGPGKVRVRWNCTQAYARIQGKWRIVSEHWSFTKPELKAPPKQ